MESLDSTETNLINRVAQELLPDSVAVEWFAALPRSRQGPVLRDLLYMAGQAHPLPQDLTAALVRSRMQPTDTPAVLIAKGRQARIPTLPDHELSKAFLLVVPVIQT